MTKTKPTKDAKKPTAAGDKSVPPDGGWRETVESVAMAVILALLFRGFVAEAFVIPTGSMAPTLDGRHKDLKCPKCGEWYQVSCSPEQDYEVMTGRHVVNGTCPVCRYTQRLNPLEHPNEGSFSGDRIIVGKFAYDLAEPKRWDVIVFKFPGSASTNYIKRLIGLPNEKVWIVGGNIYTCGKDEPETALRIARKPPAKLNALLQIVDDTDRFPAELAKIKWPTRWQNWPGSTLARSASEEPRSSTAGWQLANDGRAFNITASDTESWLRYRNIVPTYDDWRFIDENHALPPDVADRPGELVTDFYSYNTADRQQSVYSPVVPMWRWPMLSSYRPPAELPPGGPLGDPPPTSVLGEHWVDDLAVECLAEVTGYTGELSVMLVRGGVHHVCRIDLATGKAAMSIKSPTGNQIPFAGDNGPTAETPTAQTSVKGPGKYRLRLTNCDHEMLLWVNGSVVQFDGPTTYDSDDLIAPNYSAEDPGDAAPAGVSARGAAVKLSSLRILRDKYYIATNHRAFTTDYDLSVDARDIHRVFSDPQEWATSRLFAPGGRRHVEFRLESDQFMPMGDNSPASSDARLWSEDNDRDLFVGDHHYVERDLLIGKALIIYWPHTWNSPIPFLPKFSRMGPIR